MKTLTHNGLVWATHMLAEIDGVNVRLEDGTYKAGNREFYHIDDLVVYAEHSMRRCRY